MTRQDFQTGLHKAVRKAANLAPEIPRERVSTMIQRTLLGLLFVGLGVRLALASEGMTLYIGVGLVIIGSTIWSTQLVTGALKALVVPFRAFKDATKGETGE